MYHIKHKIRVNKKDLKRVVKHNSWGLGLRKFLCKRYLIYCTKTLVSLKNSQQCVGENMCKYLNKLKSSKGSLHCKLLYLSTHYLHLIPKLKKLSTAI